MVKNQNNSNSIIPSEVLELETFFKGSSLPKNPIQFDDCSKIGDSELFVKTHLEYLKKNFNKPSYAPYFDRLKEFKRQIETNSTVPTTLKKSVVVVVEKVAPIKTETMGEKKLEAVKKDVQKVATSEIINKPSPVTVKPKPISTTKKEVIKKMNDSPLDLFGSI